MIAGVVLTAFAVLAWYVESLRIERNDLAATLARIELLPDDEPSTFVRVHVDALRTAVVALSQIPITPETTLAQADEIADVYAYLDERLRSLESGPTS